jgi:SAM-dependent methyltransferase
VIRAEASRVERCVHPVERVTTVLRTRDYVTGEPFAVGECAACGLAVTVPQPDEAAIAAYYPREYYGEPGSRRFPLVVEALQRVAYAVRARAVERLAGGRPGRVLDVGCGRGPLLDAFRRRGWQVQGTELTEVSATFARYTLGIPVHVGPVEQWPWPAGHFDAIAMWHVLEHWPDPRVVLRAAQRLLRPGGVLVVSLPNFGSPEARVTGAGWFHLDVPRHLAHFTPASLHGALRETGFLVKKLSFFAPEFDAFSFVQSALNAMGVRHNLLYGLLRAPSARLVRAANRTEVLATLALAVPLGVVSLPATALLSLARRGSSMTAYAVRPG